MSQRRQANSGGYNDPFRDPFGDPFFGGGQDPFAAMMQQQEHMMMNMNRMMGGMLGGFGGFGGAMGNGSMTGLGHSMLMNDVPPRSTQRLPPRSSGPIVEEPDSEPITTSSHYRSGLDSVAPMSSFSSSSFSSSSFGGGGSGSGPVYFQSSTSTVRGPNGIVERTHSVRDSRTGIERTTMQRGMGDRARQISMERDGSGVERQHELLTNIRDEEKDAFDAEWEAQARGFGLPTPSSSAPPRSQRSQHRQIGNGGAGGR